MFAPEAFAFLLARFWTEFIKTLLAALNRLPSLPSFTILCMNMSVLVWGVGRGQVILDVHWICAPPFLFVPFPKLFAPIQQLCLQTNLLRGQALVLLLGWTCWSQLYKQLS